MLCEMCKTMCKTMACVERGSKNAYVCAQRRHRDPEKHTEIDTDADIYTDTEIDVDTDTDTGIDVDT